VGAIVYIRDVKVVVICNSIYRITQKRELLRNPTKIEEIQEKKILTEIEPLQLAF